MTTVALLMSLSHWAYLDMVLLPLQVLFVVKVNVVIEVMVRDIIVVVMRRVSNGCVHSCGLG